MAHHEEVLRDPESASVFVCELIYGIIYMCVIGTNSKFMFCFFVHIK